MASGITSVSRNLTPDLHTCMANPSPIEPSSQPLFACQSGPSLFPVQRLLQKLRVSPFQMYQEAGEKGKGSVVQWANMNGSIRDKLTGK